MDVDPGPVAARADIDGRTYAGKVDAVAGAEVIIVPSTVSVDGATQTALGQRGVGGVGGDPGIGGTNALGTALSGLVGSVGREGVAQPTLDVTP